MKAWQSLGYLGLIPFFICWVITLLAKGWQESAIQIFIFYSAIILSFISGTLWQVCSQPNNPKQQIISNVFCLLAFSALLMSKDLALITLAIGYILIFMFEKFAVSNVNKIKQYMKLRLQLTVILVVLHSLMFIKLQ